LIFFVIYQQLENHVLQPLVYGKTVQISPLVVLVAVLLGAALDGMLGAIVAIPLAASLQILVKDYAERHWARG
jgi:predicted PurR-regulated permease PerM